MLYVRPESRPGIRRRGIATVTAAALLLPLSATIATAQHAGGAGRPDTTRAGAGQGMPMMSPGPLGISPAREGSGTSWLPDASPMFAHHASAGAWALMLHENVFVQYIADGGARGHEQLGSVNWVMGMARRDVGAGEFGVRAMLSAEPLTVGECGYPDLLATGEFCDGEPIVDRQHPHDLFMELSAQYTVALSDRVGVQLYGGPVGEPALGPVAYPHRVSSLPNPIAPVSHHWLDATHITFGVATLGVFGRRWKLEGSVFNGREPDEDRYDFDFAALDSYSGRLTLAPGDRWVLQVSAGRLTEAEAPHEVGEPRVDVDRLTASVIHHRPLSGALWATAVAWGRNVEGREKTDAVLLESGLQLGRMHELFARGEVVEKNAHDLVIEELGDQIYRLGKLSGGYLLNLGTIGGLVPGIGISGAISFVPPDLEAFYGSANPVGFAVFARARPAAMEGGAAHAMAGAPEEAGDHGVMRPPSGHEPMPGHEPSARMPEHGRSIEAHTTLTAEDIEAALTARGIRLGPASEVRQPFWNVPTTVFEVHGAATPHAALHVNVYTSAAAAGRDADRIRPDGGVGTSMPSWVAPPHFFTAGNVLVTLLADPMRDPGLVRGVREAVRMLTRK